MIRPILHFCRLIFFKKSQFQVNFEHFGDNFLVKFTVDKCRQQFTGDISTCITDSYLSVNC